MYDKVLYDKILKAECSLEELEHFNNKIDENEFDLENPFQKYYDVDYIISAIEKYQNKQISDRYLAYWANAYNWIINGGFNWRINEELPLKEFLIYEISEWLDSLSFFDSCGEYYNLEENKECHRSLDTICQDLNECKVIYASYGVDEYEGEEYEDIVVLITNDKAKYFAKIENDCGFNCNARVELDYLEEYEKRLENEGYTRLKCQYEWTDEG